jgi:UDP-N-acetylglucosamine--N-acetylmuramyl-(pentapeptide) pyrophosphoryl-undecaprenol N-acetylglucosamine transferase
MKLLLAGGGTGGHLFPAVALAETLKEQDASAEVLFVGTKNGLEYQVLPELGWSLETVNISGFTGKGLMAKITVVSKLGKSVWQGRRILKKFRPDIVVGVGGYASAPLVLAAKTMKLPTLLHEQNAIPGLTNRLLARWADRVCVAFEQTISAFTGVSVILTGNPLRAGMTDCPEGVREPLTLLVFGGSRGARAINDAMCVALPKILQANPVLQVIHQTGVDDLQRVNTVYENIADANVRVEAFIHDMSTVYRDASLVVCRAGVTTVAELTACGRPAVMIPYPHAAADHQKANAVAMVEKKAAVMLEQTELSGESLANIVNEMLQNRSHLNAMAEAARMQGTNDAAEKILDICREIIDQKRAA